jgi:hypothetical protein
MRRALGDGMTRAWLAVAFSCLSITLLAQNVPDPAAVNGKPLPAPELPTGTVTVRVVREAMANIIPNQTVTLTANGKALTGRTNDAGRAEFPNLPAGADIRAETTVDGEKIVSDSFTLPASGGVRVALISGVARAAARRAQEEAAERAAPAVRGIVTIGGDTRIIGEFQGDNLFFFYQIDIVNNARAPVDIGGPFEMDLPEGASTPTLMEGSPKNATLDGGRLKVPGPFPPGQTTVNVQYQLRYTSGDYTFRQKWPVAVQQVPVFLQRIGSVTMSSPQLQAGRDVVAQNGTTFAAASAEGLAPGTELTVRLSNLPLHSKVPGYVALSLAALIVAVGVWLSVTAGKGEAARQVLLSRRDGLLARLAELEVKRREGKVADDRYLARRRRLVADLEELYHDLDEGTGRTQGGDEGVAA